MIDITYNRTENTTRVELSTFNIFNEEQLPLVVKFKNFINNKIVWTRKLDEGCWVEWSGGEVIYNFTIDTAQEQRVLDWKYQVENNGTLVEKTLYYFIKNTPHRTKGLIVGSHNGLWGQWIFPVIENACDVVMVDGSSLQLEEAKINYSHLNNCKFINEIVTPDGKDVTWFQGKEGCTDTVDKKIISKFLNEDEIISSFRTTISINNIFEQYGNFDWLYLDAEGIDSDLILSLNYHPGLIIYEPDHISDKQNIKLMEWFKLNGYKVFEELDCIAIKEI